MPVFITVRDRLAPLRELVDWLERAGSAEIVLVDNDSAYPPLLDWLESSPHRVVRVGANLGPRAAWLAGLVQAVGLDRPYVVSDPDVVPDQRCPLDLIEHLAGLLDRFPELDRVGPALRIDDLPADGVHTADVKAWEAQFWRYQIEHGSFIADIDTTFALYRPGRRRPGRPSVRTGEPYVARHLPWYQVGEPDEETAFYRSRLDPTVNSWDLEVLPPYLRALVDSTDASPLTAP
ncbi:MAG: glycosyltransferase family 2 protein [Microthrixaceae bacterium]